jgi:hypothetical protein
MIKMLEKKKPFYITISKHLTSEIDGAGDFAHYNEAFILCHPCSVVVTWLHCMVLNFSVLCFLLEVYKMNT